MEPGKSRPGGRAADEVAAVAGLGAAAAVEADRGGSRADGRGGWDVFGVDLASRAPPNADVPKAVREPGWVVAGLPGLSWPGPRAAGSGRVPLPPLGVRRWTAPGACGAVAEGGRSRPWASNGDGNDLPPIAESDGRGKFGRWLEPEADAVDGRAGDALLGITGDADAADGRVRAAVGDGGSDGRGYGFAGVPVEARGDVAGFALAALSFLS